MTEPRYRGIVPPLITPLAGPDSLDREGFGRLIDRLVGGGVSGLFILGTSGEGPSLSHRLQREVVTAGVELAGGRVPVLVGVTDTSGEECVALARHAADAGADSVVLAPPYYFPAGQTELTRYVERLAARMPLPVVLYNMPSLTKVDFEIETLRRLAGLDAVVGMKDSGGDLGYYEALCRLRAERRPDWSVLIGPESKLRAALRLGGDGGVRSRSRTSAPRPRAGRCGACATTCRRRRRAVRGRGRRRRSAGRWGGGRRRGRGRKGASRWPTRGPPRRGGSR